MLFWPQLKICARLHPYIFLLCEKLSRKKGEGWKITTVNPNPLERGGSMSEGYAKT